ncbi:MAG: D-alanyl-D-alanine carboxypeptidase/D-alanyl-D-alanine-endopeptidase [Campylobacterota bacterium]|nr:D-alanyl-D-alanine carboxypeptidase/D-alanyl-D-alanine-endopeptidase [Campylobacterota bacterium]
MKHIIFYLLISSWVLALPLGIENAIKKSGISKNSISIYINETKKPNRVIASLHAQKPRNPASVIKLMSTYAALLKLGFNYRWPTQFYITGSVKHSVLYGDLIVKGFGDPSLCSDDLKHIVKQIKSKGIREIRGNIVIDRSYFSVGNKDNSGFDQYTYSPYNAMPDAMMFNERVSTVCVTPNKRNVHKKVVDRSYNIVNKLQYVNRSCKGKYSWPGIRVDKSQAIPKIILQGKISKRCGKRNISKVITKPYKSFYYGLKNALNRSGVKVSGRMHLQKVPSNAKHIFTYNSKSLESIISKTSKKSNNLYARHLLLYLGAKVYGAPATLKKGRKAIEVILKQKSAINNNRLNIDNGSGLSRSSKVSADVFARMLDNAYRGYGKRWMNTLSIAGVDGTIKKRFRNSIVRNRAWMKTGTLKRVKNIGGYVKSQSGKLYTVVILVKTTEGRWRATQLQNSIIKWLVTYKGGDSYMVVKEEDSAPVIPIKQPLSSEKFYIQIGSFDERPNKAYISNIEDLGFNCVVKQTHNYKLLIGAYSDKISAKKALAKVHQSVNRGAFITKL